MALRNECNSTQVDQQMQQQHTCDTNASSTEKLYVTSTNEQCPEPQEPQEQSLPEINIQTTENINLEEAHVSISKVQRTTKFGFADSTNLDMFNPCKDPLYKLKIKEDEIKALKAKLKIYQQKCRRLNQRVISLTSLVKHLKDKELLSKDAAELLQSSVSSTERQILKRHLSKKKRGVFSDDIKTFAATLQFYSTKAYEYVRKTFLNILPHPQTIRRWYASVEGKPGITTEALKTVEKKIDEATTEGKILYFSLTIDDMSIREFVEIENDTYYGYVDCGVTSTKEAESDENLPKARHACVFVLVCINGSWKIPIAYYLIKSLTGAERANIIKIVLSSLHEIGAIIINITMDGCPSNITTMQCLGAHISAENPRPYFMHPQSKEKVYVMLDACHMIKLIRNAFATCKNMHDGNGNKIEWQYIINLVYLQEKEGLHAATKITRRHLNWQQEKMNVSLAVQTLSTSGANAIDFCAIDLQLPQFQNSAATSLFLFNINNIFDLLNSRNLLCKNRSQEPISLINIDRIKEDIQKYIDYLNNLFIDGVNIMNTKKKTGFLGMLICLICIQNISNELIATKKMKFLLTYKMSQDHIEMFFSAIRSKGGHNNNPSAKQFSHAYRRLLHHTKLTILPHGNTTAQDDTAILNVTHLNNGIDNIVNEFMELEEENEDEFSDEAFITENWCTSNYIKDVVAYISGFVARKVIKKIDCAICKKLLIGTDNMSALQERKCRGGLIKASNDVITLCYIAEKVIRGNSNVINKKHPAERLIIIALSHVSSNIFDNVLHMLEQAPLQDHRTDLIKLILYAYFQLRLRHICTSKNYQIQRIRSKFTKLITFSNQ